MVRLTEALAPSAGGRDRAQLLLVGAFVLAVLVVALALVLNGAAETETLATEGTNAKEGQDAVRFEQSVRRGVGGTIAGVNHESASADPTYAELQTALNDNVTEWEDLAARGYATEGAGVTVDPIGAGDIERGARITQTDASRNFTDVTATEDWTLNNQTDPITETRDFEMNVSRAELASSCGSCFTVVADNGTATWRAELRNASGDIELTVDPPPGAGSTTTCSVAENFTVIDFSAGTVASGTCSFPAFAEGLSGGYNISYANGQNANGTYQLVVRETRSNVDSSPSPYATSGGDPTLTRAIYSADVAFEYRTPRLTYRNTLEKIVPGDRDA